MFLHYKKMVRIARLATLLAPILAVICGLLLVLFTRMGGVFQGGTIMLLPFALAIVFMAWKWSLLGGILALSVIPLIFPMLSSNYPGWYKAPFIVFWAVFIAGGVLHISAFIEKNAGVAGTKPPPARREWKS